MINLLNAVSSTMIGIISIVIILAILAVTVIINLKMKKYTITTNFVAFLLALLLSIFLAKPILSLFDKMFSFSMVFFNVLMFQFGQIDIMNKQVTVTNYLDVVDEFNGASLGLSDTLKNFLSKIFDKTTVSSSNPTTLGAIASTSLSYIFSLFIVAFILFVVNFTLLKLLFVFLKKRIEWKNIKINQKVLGGILGGLKGIIIVFLFLITISTLPFFGISIDYFGTGFENTKIFNPLYNVVVNAEQDMYLNAINFGDINRKSYGNKSNVEIATYQNDLENADYRINVQIGNENITCTVTNLSTADSDTNTYKYIYVNSALYLYKNNKLELCLNYNEKDKIIIYKDTIWEKTVRYSLKVISY